MRFVTSDPPTLADLIAYWRERPPSEQSLAAFMALSEEERWSFLLHRLEIQVHNENTIFESIRHIQAEATWFVRRTE